MEDLGTRYWGSFMACGLLCAVMLYAARSKATTAVATAQSAKFASFQKIYLFVFLLAMFSDWLQGPYVYELYVSYGFSQAEIAELFVCGFASSMVVGTFVGGLADKMGRKMMCIMYCVCYIIACCTKLVPDYWTLMLGRFLSGVSTSLLFSVFESWMVCEHFKQGFEAGWLNDTFAYATFGNGLVAVIAGLIANSAAESYGFVAPFVVAIIPLSVVAITVATSWPENHGNQQLNMLSSLSKGFDLVRNDSRIAALGFGQSCFEGSRISVLHECKTIFSRFLHVVCRRNVHVRVYVDPRPQERGGDPSRGRRHRQHWGDHLVVPGPHLRGVHGLRDDRQLLL
jgi:MFS family permease